MKRTLTEDFGTRVDDRTCPSTACSPTIPDVPTARTLVWNEPSNAKTLADQIASYRGALTARQLSELLSISAVTIFKIAKRGTSVISSGQLRAPLPGGDRSLVAGARRLDLTVLGSSRAPVLMCDRFRLPAIDRVRSARRYADCPHHHPER